MNTDFSVREEARMASKAHCEQATNREQLLLDDLTPCGGRLFWLVANYAPPPRASGETFEYLCNLLSWTSPKRKRLLPVVTVGVSFPDVEPFNTVAVLAVERDHADYLSEYCGVDTLVTSRRTFGRRVIKASILKPVPPTREGIEAAFVAFREFAFTNIDATE